ncbi:MAG: NAD(P)/FAD-dependent oxidoreductase [Gammaproteobacteria bacterium]
MEKVDVIIIGGGAAGLMCAIEAGKRHRKVVVLDHTNKAGKKILMSGGGRCNFTNYHINPADYISHNPHFCKSALSRFTQWDFIDLVKRHHIPFHEKSLGQLFCDNKSKDILDMLLTECEQAGVSIRLNTKIEHIEKLNDHHFKLNSSRGDFHAQSVVVATGGLSIPTMGASPFGYQLAEKFGIKVWPTRAGLVPFTLQPEDKEKLAVLSGIGVDSLVSNAQKSFRENILFTHRGLSGPAILQISSYWYPGEMVTINLLPEIDLFESLKSAQQQQPQKQLKTILTLYFAKRVIEIFFPVILLEKKLTTISHQDFFDVAQKINQWEVFPNGTEGYRTAEVTLGGIDCDAISSKTMEANAVKGLFFIGEALDVTGWLGGFNFQWAWSSGWAAGQVV